MIKRLQLKELKFVGGFLLLFLSIVFVSADTTSPTFITIPDDTTISYMQGFGVDFDGTDETEFDTYFINWTNTFQMNSSGYLENATTNIAVGVYLINVSINDTAGNINSTIYEVTVDKAAPTGTLAGASPITYPITGDVEGVETNVGDGGCVYKLYREGVEVSSPDTTILNVGVWNYIYNTTGCANYSASASLDTFVLTVNNDASVNYVEEISDVTLNGGATKTVYVLFNVSGQYVDENTANISFSKSGEITRYATSCNNDTFNNQFNCTIQMQFYDSAGADWNINASIVAGGELIDNKSVDFTVNALDYVSQDVSLIGWPLVVPDSSDEEADNTITLTNGGNQDYSVFTIKGFDSANTVDFIYTESFSVDSLTGQTTGQIYLINNSAVDVTGVLTFPPHSASATEEIFFYVDVPAAISIGEYIQVENWKIAVAT
jgi:hypothetical protein